MRDRSKTTPNLISMVVLALLVLSVFSWCRSYSVRDSLLVTLQGLRNQFYHVSISSQDGYFMFSGWMSDQQRPTTEWRTDSNDPYPLFWFYSQGSFGYLGSLMVFPNDSHNQPDMLIHQSVLSVAAMLAGAIWFRPRWRHRNHLKAEQGGVWQARSHRELIDFPDSNS